jgi:hypothetical protein
MGTFPLCFSPAWGPPLCCPVEVTSLHVARFLRNLLAASPLVVTSILQREIVRWFPQRNSCDTPLSVSTWQNFHAIQRTGSYGTAWLKDGFGALKWPDNKAHLRKVAARENCIGSPHTLGLTNICLSPTKWRQGRLCGPA